MTAQARIDLHMHTNHSDGSHTPRELVRHAKEKGLACISVTDHDTMSSYEECLATAKELEIELIPGVELSCLCETGTLHMLGFFQDRKHPRLNAAFEEVQKARKERNPEIIRMLNRLGIPITLEEVAAESGGKQIGRPHFAQALVKRGVVASIQEAFQKYLAKGMPAYVDKRKFSSREAIERIREAGGIPVVAHPKQMKLDEAGLEKEIVRLKEEGLGGIEIYNSCHKPHEAELYKRLAKRFNLFITGGSDFHGANKPGVELGVLGDGAVLDYEVVEKMKASLNRKN